jgi:hypothetical protein
MQSLKKSAIDPDEIRFPVAKRILVTCKKSTFNKGQFTFGFMEGQSYQAFALINGKDYIVWFSPDEWEAISGSTFTNYFSRT